ncbi:hypothetical protein KP509_1Z159000 [Ceratopteris richardii]|nr:hypothetical protein KP509_1Z159000 [Ceratopteris richardii]
MVPHSLSRWRYIRPPRLILQIFSDPEPPEDPARRGVSHYKEQRIFRRQHRRLRRPVRRASLHQREIQAIHTRHDIEIRRRQQRTPGDLDVQSILRIATMP